MTTACDLGPRELERGTTIRLVEHAWDSHLVATSIAALLLNSVLAYDVERVPLSVGEPTFAALANGSVHADVETWPDTHAMVFRRHVRVRQDVVSLGTVGYGGQSGLYATPSLLDPAASWRALRLNDTMSRAPTSAELGRSASDVHVGAEALCAPEPARCPLVIHPSREYEEGIVEGLVDGLGLDAAVWYAQSEGAFNRLVRERVEAGEPTLAYAWRPSRLIAGLASEQFSRVFLPEHGRGCTHNLTANDRRVECDFPTQTLVKLSASNLARRQPTAARLLSVFTIPPSVLDEMIDRLARTRGADDTTKDGVRRAADDVACAWLQENRELWAPWITSARASSAPQSAALAGGLLVGVSLALCLLTCCCERLRQSALIARRAAVARGEAPGALGGRLHAASHGLPRPIARVVRAISRVHNTAARRLGFAPSAACAARAVAVARDEQGGAGAPSAGAPAVAPAVAAVTSPEPPPRTVGDAPAARAAPSQSCVSGRTCRQLAVSIGLILASLALSAAFYGVVEGFSLVESCYFAVVTFTTVGYGDVTPKTVKGRGFTILFALLSMGVLGIALVTFVSALLEAEARARKRLLDASLRSLDRMRSRSRARLPKHSPLGGRLGHRAPRAGGHAAALAGAASLDTPAAVAAAQLHAPVAPSGRADGDAHSNEEEIAHVIEEQVQTPLQFALTAFRLAQPILLCICLLVALGCGLEGYSLVDGIYYAVISVTTIGFGDLSPQTASGRAFACVLLPFSVASTAKAVSALVQHTQFQLLLSKTKDVTKLLQSSGAASLTEVEFVLHVLVVLYDVDDKVADALHAQFRALDRDRNGVLDLADLIECRRREEPLLSVRQQLARRRAPPAGAVSVLAQLRARARGHARKAPEHAPMPAHSADSESVEHARAGASDEVDVRVSRSPAMDGVDTTADTAAPSAGGGVADVERADGAADDRIADGTCEGQNSAADRV